VLGGLIGLEREHHGRPAGLRTHVLVALGSALAMVVSVRFGDVYASAGQSIRVDPARVAYGVMVGMGFIGAGAIIHYSLGIRGLTTAASLWCAAAVGLATGFGMFVVAAAGAMIVLFVLTVMDVLEHHLPSRLTRTITLSLAGVSTDVIERHRKLFREAGLRFITVSSTQDFKAGQLTLTYVISGASQRLSGAIEALRREAGEMISLRIE